MHLAARIKREFSRIKLIFYRLNQRYTPNDSKGKITAKYHKQIGSKEITGCAI